jgi:cell wall-associated NlpC family hydrolase
MRAIVTSPIASLFKLPDETSELADEALYGMGVEIVDETNRFFKVKTDYRYFGYTLKENLLTDEENVASWDIPSKVVGAACYLDVLAKPDVTSNRLAALPKGGALIPIGEYNETFTKVLLPNTQVGYVKTPSLREQVTTWDKKKENAIRENLIETAMSYMGTQYRWGGKTHLGIDCSGLCSISYLLNGIVIYRDASIKPGFEMHEIPYEDMKPADLIFYGEHVVMYIGEGKVLHSTAYKTSVGVCINSLEEDSPIFRRDLKETIVMVGSVF